MLFVFGTVVICEATTISTSATGSQFGDNYGYTFLIAVDSSDSTLFHAILKNTSISTLDPLIDKFAFNLNATIGTDFDILNTEPTDWLITTPTGRGIKFDYVGAGDADDRLHAGETLAFDFDFVDAFAFPTDSFELWTSTDSSLGKGLGGGEDYGQVAVSFQRLGGGSADESDLLASNWSNGVNPVPEPATMLLLSSGLIGIAASGRKRFKKTNK